MPRLTILFFWISSSIRRELLSFNFLFNRVMSGLIDAFACFSLVSDGSFNLARISVYLGLFSLAHSEALNLPVDSWKTELKRVLSLKYSPVLNPLLVTQAL